MIVSDKKKQKTVFRENQDIVPEGNLPGNREDRSDKMGKSLASIFSYRVRLLRNPQFKRLYCYIFKCSKDLTSKINQL
ncbi:hypothetical protein J6TS1_17090 [Siminovitchia terrae]|uniref:Uncharacterized protein n=1 Tax=Siminovitchia terrae TaxID=1914933 RepID=A0ABQ4KV10_SIMTE|nr:hypothetical protein J6TS1_17090 [Siminovitchia terrae]